jgi:chemotaxis protein methyltransferase CheR
MPSAWLTRFFDRSATRDNPIYTVKPAFRQKVTFRRLNLMDKFSNAEKYPVIFCRNVMIYFNKQTQGDLVNRLAACLEPGGYLFVGHAESLTGIDHPLRYVQPAVYQKPA